MEAEEFWESHYAGQDRIWSGRPNALLADAVAGLTPGRALDLGCGEEAHPRFQTPREIYDGLGLDPAGFEPERLEAPGREATGPAGETATVLDTVVAIRRR